MDIRTAQIVDLPAIMQIYDDEVLHGVGTFDTEQLSEEKRRAWFASHDPVHLPVIVAVVNDIIIGWASLSAWSDRRAYARTAEVSLYVEKGHRRRGSGRALLGDLITCARNAGLAVLIARIAEGNQVSLKLFQSMGFHRIGTMRRVGEKFGRVLDVELLDLQLEA